MIVTGIPGFKKPRGNPAAKVFFYIFLILFLAAVAYGLWQKYSGQMPMNRSMQMNQSSQ